MRRFKSTPVLLTERDRAYAYASRSATSAEMAVGFDAQSVFTRRIAGSTVLGAAFREFGAQPEETTGWGHAAVVAYALVASSRILSPPLQQSIWQRELEVNPE